MRNKLTVSAAAMVAVVASTCVLAAECGSFERDKAQTFAERAGDRVVQKYLGGRDIRVALRGCEFNSYDGKFRVKVEINWNGAIVRSNSYNVDGNLTFDRDGSNSNFSQTYASESVRELSMWGAIVGGVVVLGMLGAEAGATQGSTSGSASSLTTGNSGGTPVFFDNACNRPMDVTVRYKNMVGTWIMGRWSFDANQRAKLSLNGNALSTNTADIYYYALTSDGSNLVWQTTGENQYEFNGRTIAMRKIVDETAGKTEIRVTCP